MQADLRAGFTGARDMSSHGNGYGDVDIRNAITEGRIEGPRYQVSGKGIIWACSKVLFGSFSASSGRWPTLMSTMPPGVRWSRTSPKNSRVAR